MLPLSLLFKAHALVLAESIIQAFIPDTQYGFVFSSALIPQCDG